ncbi:Thymidylate synthase [Candidatus Providencia siddallii]|uniref:Thymidylate synthase n=1 Tax=Candidatus Providencia siddallii TaxID=1715285 RepID=A0A0M6W6S9_9GAMM|nr:Thymidylate synthase [Candidatus Providencia siddallii]
MKEYLDLCQRIINEGKWIKNKRTGVRCLTIINAEFEYNVRDNQFPIITTRKGFYKSAIAELLGYLRGYDNAAQFREIGCNTWNDNANKNQDWLNNPYRKDKDDMGRIYGIQGRSWQRPNGSKFDQLKKIINNLKRGIDDRAEIITFFNPGEIEMGCLRPCMHTHTFSLLGETLYLTSYQRSCDVPLGLNFNQIHCFVLLMLMARFTNYIPGKAYHKIVNAHIYENQLPLLCNIQLKRKPFQSPSLIINPKIKKLEDIETWVSVDDFIIQGYRHHGAIKYPFTI